MDFRVTETWVQILTLSLTGYVDLGSPLPFCTTQILTPDPEHVECVAHSWPTVCT